MNRCITGKRGYASPELAEEVLIEAWTRYEYKEGQGPIAVYQCDDCGHYHLTSRGPMNERLAASLADGRVRKQKEARRWEDKLKRR